ncbi:type III-A CRISPR-associated RAMP protein Csm3 [Methanobrevibacter filiformis]|uniref:CRISPR system Cms endoribonuclease Csm3 n=1 Tax=Methanobrevibacter filiformis TaxID=55758 RepID=A0A166FFM2_9EURY|nr:type III-A CRISPR-associated RAMP protein Csm3 [Methanobrevibacter filiformis]KZX17625.1 RAMP superfamily protein [Methanobrevibacter filiformis]
MSESNEFGFQGNILIDGKIVCETGLYIGESNDSLEIGGIDRMVIRDKESDLPYIPGSSLKGKLRSLLELYFKDSTDNIIHPKNDKDRGNACTCGKCVPCQIFGFSNNDEVNFEGPTRIIVRDAFYDDKTKKFWKNTDDISRGTELKIENRIDRIKGTAKDPRPTERVPKGSVFTFNIVFSIYSNIDKENFKHIFTAIELLQHSYLGGSGSRGYGQVSFNNVNIIERPKSFYTSENEYFDRDGNLLLGNFEKECKNYVELFNIKINPDEEGNING